MANAPVRRAQLIAPFGVGALMTTSDGVTLIMAGLDYWFQGTRDNLDLAEFELKDEWRLSEELGVRSLRLPPDFRKPFRNNDESATNTNIVMPAFRFPLWSFCPKCYLLYIQTPFESNNRRCVSCLKPESKNRYGTRTVQVAFIAMCKDGHIQDFPFREWAHRTSKPDCDQPLSLSLSGATLSTQLVTCKCGKTRNFDGIFAGGKGEDESSFLSKSLDESADYLCQGSRPWLAESDPSGCGNQLFGGLTGSVNNYYAHIQSAIFLPQTVEGISQDLMDTFSGNRFQQFFEVASSLPIEDILTFMQAQGLAGRLLPLLNGVSLRDAVEAYLANRSSQGKKIGENVPLKDLEFDFLSKSQDLETQNLATRVIPIEKYVLHRLSKLIQGVTAVDKLRETRALIGFDRLKPQPERSVAELKNLMSKMGQVKDWLPAYEVYGEGIFISFDDLRFNDWALNPEVQKRINPLRINKLTDKIFSSVDETFLPRYVAIHTISHLLINQMTFTSGYAAASLRERIYVTPHTEESIGGNGLLIYTASGDVEGSLGGLVRLSAPDRFETLIDAALEAANFCATDPVCMEVGALGQGPDSLNLAACHNCTLLPETSCEAFNVFLDRGLIVGTLSEMQPGVLQWLE